MVIMARLSMKTIQATLKRIVHESKVRAVSVYHSANSHDDNPETRTKDNAVIRKFNDLNDWYIKLTGLDEIKRLQDRVIRTQEKLEKAQEERREVGKLLVDIRKKSTELQEQLQTVKRWENSSRFLDLTRQETDVIKLEKEYGAKFEVLDKSEREIFTTLSNAVRDSHEKEKAHSEYTKYWGVILSLVSTIVGAVVTLIVSSMRNHQMVTGIQKGVEEQFEQLKHEIIAIRGSESGTSIMRDMHELIHRSLRPIMIRLDENTKQNEVLLRSVNENRLAIADQLKVEDGNVVNIGGFWMEQKRILEEQKEEVNQALAKQSWLSYGVGFLALLSWFGGR